MSKKPTNSEKSGRTYTPTISNKKAHFNYILLEKFEAGMALVGTEVKSLRQGTANLEEAFARIRDGELFLFGCTIPVYSFGNITNHDPKRVRKLLVRRRELRTVEGKLNQKGLTLVPLRIYFTHGLAKIELALARGKTHGDKREKLRDREHNRDIRRAMERRKH
jgi:SsrA-binding protein